MKSLFIALIILFSQGLFASGDSDQATLEKLKDPSFRLSFVDETLKRQGELSFPISDIRLTEETRLLRLMFASVAFTDQKELSLFTKKVMKQLSLENQNELTPLQWELAQLPISSVKYFDSYSEKLQLAKKVALERIKLINFSIYAHIFRPDAQRYLLEVWYFMGKVFEIPGARSNDPRGELLADQEIFVPLEKLINKLKLLNSWKPEQSPKQSNRWFFSYPSDRLNGTKSLSCSRLFN